MKPKIPKWIQDHVKSKPKPISVEELKKRLEEDKKRKAST